MFTTLRALFLVALLAGPLVLPASSDASSQGNSMQRREERSEQRLIKEVRHQLLLLPYYSVFDNLQYKVEGDKVILMGQVVRPTLKSDAEHAVKSIEGVATVDNQIEVLPVSPNDDRIRRAVYRAIYRDPVLSRYELRAVPPIHIIVKNGHVTLEGAVASEADKNLANIRASEVPNVFSVTNHLIIDKS